MRNSAKTKALSKSPPISIKPIKTACTKLMLKTNTLKGNELEKLLSQNSKSLTKIKTAHS